MFNDWMEDYSSETVRVSWRKVIRAGEPYEWSDDLKEAMYKKEGGPFLSHALLCSMNISRQRNEQQKRIGFLLKFKGLSREGLKYLAWLGVVPSVRTIDRFIKAKKIEAQQRSRYMIVCERCLIRLKYWD